MKYALLLATALMMTGCGEEKKCKVSQENLVAADGPLTKKDWHIDWAKCKTDIEKFDETKALLTAEKTLKADVKEEDVYQALLKHDKDLEQACNDNCHTPYEKVTCKEG